MVVAGSQLIVIGRYTAAGQEWWQTNYANSWWLNQPGTAGVLSGDCGVIPFIIP
jgi:hypothetical protein